MSLPRVTIADAPDTVAVFTTVATEDEAVTLGGALLERRLVACGTVLPGARSLYRWQGKLADEREAVVVLKTTRPRVAALEAAFAELHPYAVPELLALPVAAGLARYVAWVNAETTPAETTPAAVDAHHAPPAGGAATHQHGA